MNEITTKNFFKEDGAMITSVGDSMCQYTPQVKIEMPEVKTNNLVGMGNGGNVTLSSGQPAKGGKPGDIIFELRAERGVHVFSMMRFLGVVRGLKLVDTLEFVVIVLIVSAMMRHWVPLQYCEYAMLAWAVIRAGLTLHIFEGVVTFRKGGKR